MGERIDLYRNRRDKARREAASANVRQDNITRRGGQVLAPINPFDRPSRDNYQSYPYDYFSGTDAKIFFGDIWVDDIVTIQWNVSQSKTPFYGYASQLFDAVAKGQVIVQGSVTIAFKETGYLNIIQTLLNRQKNNRAENIEHVLKKHSLRAEYGASKFIPGITTVNTESKDNGVVYASNGTPQFIRQQETIEDVLHGKIGEALGTSYGLSTKERDFEDFAEILEDTIWGDSNGRPIDANINKKLLRADEFDYNSRGGINVGKAPYSDVLNILLTFGDINDFRAEHTILSINDVHFQSQGMIVSPDGAPLAETYNFFAREINNEIGRSVYKINPIKLETGVDNLAVSKLENVDALQDQLVKEKTPQYVTIIARAGLPRGSKWKALTGKDAWIIKSDHKDLSATGHKEQIDDADDKVTKYESRDTKRGTRKTKEEKGKKDALEQNYDQNFQFTFNGHEPLIDQLIRLVEREVNEFDGNTVKLEYAQYIVDVEFEGAAGNPWGAAPITMVLDQSIPNSRTYKVIAPTRQNFGTQNIITREDLFRDVKPAIEFDEELTALSSDLQEQHKRAQASAAEYQKELDRLTKDRSTEFKEDITKRQQQIDKLTKERADGDLNKFEERKLSRLVNEQLSQFNDLAELNNGEYTDADVELLGRKNQAEFEANRVEYDRLDKEADYYENEANRVDATHDEFISDIADEEAARQLTDYEKGLPKATQKADIEFNNTTNPNEVSNDTSYPLGTSRPITIDQKEGRRILQEYNQQIAQELGLKLKDDSVYVAELIPEIKSIIPNISNAFGYSPVITSANDNLEHSFKSAHYSNAALDLRTRDIGEFKTAMVADMLQQDLGSDYRVIIESDHIHLEYNPNRPNKTGYAIRDKGVNIPYSPSNTPTPKEVVPPSPEYSDDQKDFFRTFLGSSSINPLTKS